MTVGGCTFAQERFMVALVRAGSLAPYRPSHPKPHRFQRVTIGACIGRGWCESRDGAVWPTEAGKQLFGWALDLAKEKGDAGPCPLSSRSLF